MAGGKLMYLLDHHEQFLANPLGSLFSPSGFSAYGGFILGIILAQWVIRRSTVKASVIFDAVAPSLAIAYGIARIGCQLAGDGCYGKPSTLPWAMSYPQGMIPTAQLVHPAPVYELLWSVLIFMVLWKARKHVQLVRPAPRFSRMGLKTRVSDAATYSA